MSKKRRTVPAGEFKQGCLALLDEIEATHLEVIITKRGRPVAKVVSLEGDEEREEALLAGLQGKARMMVQEKEFLAPTQSEWGDVE